MFTIHYYYIETYFGLFTQPFSGASLDRTKDRKAMGFGLGGR